MVLPPGYSSCWFLLKPCMWCRSDARLWHFFLSPLCGVAQTPDCGVTILHFPLEESFRHLFGTSIIILHFPARGVFQTLVWHQYYYSAFSARGVFQTLIWHQYYYSAFFRSRSLSDTRLAPSIYYLYV